MLGMSGTLLQNHQSELMSPCVWSFHRLVRCGLWCARATARFDGARRAAGKARLRSTAAACSKAMSRMSRHALCSLHWLWFGVRPASHVCTDSVFPKMCNFHFYTGYRELYAHGYITGTHDTSYRYT